MAKFDQFREQVLARKGIRSPDLAKGQYKVAWGKSECTGLSTGGQRANVEPAGPDIMNICSNGSYTSLSTHTAFGLQRM